MLSNLGAQRHLFHIRDNIILARDFIQSLTYEAFRGDVLVFYAVTRCLEIISEASRRIPVEMKARQYIHVGYQRLLKFEVPPPT